MARVYFIWWMRDAALSTETNESAPSESYSLQSQITKATRTNGNFTFIYRRHGHRIYAEKTEHNFQTTIIESSRRMDAFRENVQRYWP